jgi:hypothetical protein
MSTQENKSILAAAAEAFNDPARRAEWLGIHDPSVVAHGLGPASLRRPRWPEELLRGAVGGFPGAPHHGR